MRSPILERVFANRIDRPVGSVVYTATLTRRGGIRLDLTVTRKDQNRFRVVTGGGSGHHDEAFLRSQIRDEERVHITVRTGSLFALGLWGPRARDVLSAVTDVDVSNEAFPYLTARYLSIGEVTPVWAQRISYAGELGWELYGQIAMGQRAWDVLWEAGREHGLVAAGGGAFDSLRLEKGYRLWAQDIDTEHDPLAAGLGFAVRWDKDFTGKAALEAIRDAGGPAQRLSCLTLDDRSRGRDGQGAPVARRPRRVVRDERGLRVLDRSRHRLRLPARRARGRGHPDRGGVLR